MKQNANIKWHHENVINNYGSKPSKPILIQIQEQAHKSELKAENIKSQILFKKEEKVSKTSLIQSLHQLKTSFQASRTKQNHLFKQKSQQMELLLNKSSTSKKLPLNSEPEVQKQIQKAKKAKKHSNSSRNPLLSQVDQQHEHTQKEVQRITKKQLKQLKKAQKQNKKQQCIKNHLHSQNSILIQEQNQQISNQLFSIFSSKYQYYLNQKKIIFPIEDTLLELYHQLAPQNLEIQPVKRELLQRKLPRTFCKQLQIWNMLIQHPSFFNVNDEIKLQQIPKLIRQENICGNATLFRNFHKFYLSDIIINRYEQSSDQDYFSYVSLWRYADENNFLEKIFRVHWNKIILFYISLQKNNYQNLSIISQFQIFENILTQDIKEGKFQIFTNYDELINYLIFLLNMCFETITFKSLINNKMLFFRDNNKIKNQLLDEKKSIDNKLWELKQTQKALIKRQKMSAKVLKKQSKMIVQEDNNQYRERLRVLQEQNEEINKQKELILLKRQQYHNSIVDIDNKIYELCCLPQFSNVWLLGEDRHYNSYWFVRESQNAIYRQCKQTGQWGVIQYKNIEKLLQSLNIKGIRQRKLYEKISYYKQLGYIKFNDEDKKQNMQIQQIIISNSSKNNEEVIENEQSSNICYDIGEFQRFSFTQYKKVTPYIIKIMILKSQWMMSKYLFQRNSKWTTEENRQEYINTIMNHDLKNLDVLTQELRLFNEKICVVEINIKIANENEGIDLKTRKIQTKIWGINEKYKHFWYDYSKKCKDLSDLHFLISILYLTIERYVTKTRKPTNTKYFFKTIEIGQNTENNENFNEEEMLFS